MLKPCHNRVLLKLIKQQDSTIIRPEAADVLPFQRWEVQAVGPDVKCCVASEVVILVPGANVIPLPDFDNLGLGLVTDASIVMVEA